MKIELDYPLNDFITFEVPGEPVGKGRPIMSSKSHTCRTPEKTRNYESFVALQCSEALKAQKKVIPASDGGLTVVITAFMKVPENKPKKFIESVKKGILKPTKKPDIDNLVKSILDGINLAGVWLDDKCVTTLAAYKIYTMENPRVQVQIGW